MACPHYQAAQQHMAQHRANRRDLRHWHPAWDAQNNHFHRPTRFALRGEFLFLKLCEAIVRYIEAPTLMNAGEWLNIRVPYRDIIALGTFGRFVEIMQEDSTASGDREAARLRGMLFSAPHELRDADDDDNSFSGLMDMVRQLKEDKSILGGGFVLTDELTYRRLEGWYARITASRNRLYRRLYGVRRRSISDD